VTETDLSVKIGADSSGLGNALQAANRSSEQFSANFKTSVDNLNVSLKNLNETLGAIHDSTQRTADATQHLSTVTNFLLTITGIKLVSEAVSATASGLVSLGSATASAAASFASYAQAQGYVIGQTNAVRVANDNFGGTLVRSVLPSVAQVALEFGALNVAIRAAPAVVGVTTSAVSGLATAIRIAAGAAVEFGLRMVSLTTVLSFLAARGLKVLTDAFMDLAGVLVRAGQAFGEYLNWASRYDDAGSRMAAKTLTMAGNLAQFEAEMKRTGQTDATRGLQNYLAELDKIPPKLGKTKEENAALAEQAKQASVDLEAAFASLPSYTAPLNDFLVKAVRLLATNTDEARQWGTTFADAFRDLNGSGERFLRSIQDIDPHLLENFKHAQQTGNVMDMQRTIMQGILVLTDRANDAEQRRYQEAIRTGQAMGMSREEAEKWAASTDETLRHAKDLSDVYDKIRLSAQGAAISVKSLGDNQKESYKQAVDLSNNGGTNSAQIRIHQANIDALREGIKAEPGNQDMKDTLNEELQKLRELNDARAGGNEESKLAVKLAKDELAHGTDSLGAARQKVEVLERHLAVLENADHETGQTSVETQKYVGQLAAAKKLVLDLEAGVKATRKETEILGETRGSSAWVKASLDALNARHPQKGGAVEQAAYEKDKNAIEQAGAEFRANQEKQQQALALDDIKLKYAKLMDNLDGLEKRHLVSSEEASQQRISFLKQEDVEVGANYEKQLARYGEDETEYSALLKKKQHEHDAYLKAIDQAETRELEKLDQEAQTAAGHLTSGLQGAISSAIQGKSPWKGLADSLVSELSSALTNNLKSILSVGLGQLGIGSMINGILSGDTLKSGLSSLFGGAGGATALTGSATALTGSATALTGAATALTSAAAALSAGGAASAAGGAAAASSGGFLSTLGSAAAGLLAFDVGSWSVPSQGNFDGKGGWPALIHPGEMIIPAGPASNLRNATASGGGLASGGSTSVTHNHNWNIQSNDARSFMNLFQNNSQAVTQMIAKVMNANPSLRPSY